MQKETQPPNPFLDLEFPDGGVSSPMDSEFVENEMPFPKHMLSENYADFDSAVHFEAMNALGVGNLKDFSDRLRIGSDSVNKFLDAQKTVLEAEGNLEKVAKLTKVVSNISKVSAGFGVLGAGLGIFELALDAGKPSDTELILSAIDGVNEKIDDLKESLFARIDHLSDENDVRAAKTDIKGFISTLSPIRILLSAYLEEAKKLKKSEKPDFATLNELKRRLLEYNSKEIFTAVVGLHDNITSATFRDLANNLVDATYKASYGSLMKVSAICSEILDFAMFGALVDPFISILKEEEKDGKRDKDDAIRIGNTADGVYDKLIRKMVLAWELMCKKCTNNNEIKHNVDKLMREGILPNIGEADSIGEKENAAKSIRAQLYTQWPFLDWFVCVYEPVVGNTEHQVSGWNTKTYFRTNKKNIVIHWDDKHHPPEGQNWSTIRTFTPAHADIWKYEPFFKDQHHDYWKKMNKFHVGRLSIPSLKIPIEDENWGSLKGLSTKMDKPLDAPGLFFMYRIRYKGHDEKIKAAWTNDKRVYWNYGTVKTIVQDAASGGQAVEGSTYCIAIVK